MSWESNIYGEQDLSSATNSSNFSHNTNIKNTYAIVSMTGAGTQYSDTQIAHLTTAQRTTLNPSQPSSLQPGQTIDDTNLESFMSSLANAYSTERGNTYTLTKTICHSSCHSSCHGSRGRR